LAFRACHVGSEQKEKNVHGGGLAHLALITSGLIAEWDMNALSASRTSGQHTWYSGRGIHWRTGKHSACSGCTCHCRHPVQVHLFGASFGSAQQTHPHFARYLGRRLRNLLDWITPDNLPVLMKCTVFSLLLLMARPCASPSPPHSARPPSKNYF
jgi:hypothetical protein